MRGRHRADDSRTGWISGLGEHEGESHPTRGGLRIGKQLPERGARDPFDDRLEWERDGQYFHYLTKWMHALDQVAGATGELRFELWARELAAVAHASFFMILLLLEGSSARTASELGPTVRRPSGGTAVAMQSRPVVRPYDGPADTDVARTLRSVGDALPRRVPL